MNEVYQKFEHSPGHEDVIIEAEPEKKSSHKIHKNRRKKIGTIDSSLSRDLRPSNMLSARNHDFSEKNGVIKVKLNFHRKQAGASKLRAGFEKLFQKAKMGRAKL